VIGTPKRVYSQKLTSRCSRADHRADIINIEPNNAAAEVLNERLLANAFGVGRWALNVERFPVQSIYASN